MKYGDALRVLARLEGVPEPAVEALVASKFEYVVASQIYDTLKNKSKKEDDKWKARSIDELRHTFPANLRVAYVEGDAGSDAVYSVLLGVTADGEDKVEYKVKLPGPPILGEGKPENQNHAIVFTRGEHLQTLDMNQDNYMGEAFKMRNMLECFKGDVRLVGCREHIFSEAGGAVAEFAASNEFVFGTSLQRFLTFPLSVRFHYGHPDVWDKQWAVQRRRVEGLQDAAPERGHLRRDERGHARRRRLVPGVHPRGQGARHDLHRDGQLHVEDLGRQRTAVDRARHAPAERALRPRARALALGHRPGRLRIDHVPG